MKVDPSGAGFSLYLVQPITIGTIPLRQDFDLFVMDQPKVMEELARAENPLGYAAALAANEGISNAGGFVATAPPLPPNPYMSQYPDMRRSMV